MQAERDISVSTENSSLLNYVVMMGVAFQKNSTLKAIFKSFHFKTGGRNTFCPYLNEA